MWLMVFVDETKDPREEDQKLATSIVAPFPAAMLKDNFYVIFALRC